MSIDWQVYFLKSFNVMLEQLTDEVELLALKNPDEFQSHEKTKLLAKIYHVIFKDIAINPLSPHFNLGNTLGKKYRAWKRAKDRMPNRLRLFFRFNSQVQKIIIVWMNNEFTLRKRGDKKDVYNVFLSMIHNKEIPSDWDSLYKRSIPKIEEIGSSNR